jgi:catechol 2,3-dioxygenase-like lactoylglutathione lyase family enzyme
MQRAIAFYGGVLCMEQTFDTTLRGTWIEEVTGLPNLEARCVFFALPSCDVRLELLEYSTPRGAAVEINRLPNTLGVRHFAFEVDDIEAFCQRLQNAGVPLVSPPVTVPFPVGNKGTKRLCYFHDPDGTLLEVAEYSK